MDELKKLQEMAGIQINEGMAEQQLLYLYAALRLVIEDKRSLTTQELSDMLVTYAPNVLPPDWIKKKAQKTYSKQNPSQQPKTDVTDHRGGGGVHPGAGSVSFQD